MTTPEARDRSTSMSKRTILCFQCSGRGWNYDSFVDRMIDLKAECSRCNGAGFRIVRSPA